MADDIGAQSAFPVTTKRCSRCKAMVGLSLFGPHKKYGLQGWCKPCFQANSLANREKIRERSKAWYHANKEHCAAQAKVYQKENRDRFNALAAKYRERNPEAFKAAKAKYRATPEGKAKEIASRKAWVAANPDKVRKYARDSQKRNLPKVMARNHAIRAQRRGTGGKHTAADIADLEKIQGGKCAHSWCRADFRKAKRHVDHIMPLVRGGTNDRRNLQLLCSTCNLKKKAEHPIDFAQKNGLLL